MDFAGVQIGHATDSAGHTGCTVFLCPPGTVGSVDIRGGGPGSRETALLAPDKHVQEINAVVLSGGSAFGLSTADGVMRYLADLGIGYRMPAGPVPIVAAAIVYDLSMTGGKRLPDAAMGRVACENASVGNAAQGNVGAGAGVTCGTWLRPGAGMKGGFGLASFRRDGLVVSAAAVVNSLGDIVDEDGTVLAGARLEAGGWAASHDPFRRFHRLSDETRGSNTTLVVIATNAPLSKLEANRLAQRGHDGMAIAIRPAHTSLDGDTVFALATASVGPRQFDNIANIAVVMVAEAIRSAVRHASSAGPWPGLADWSPQQKA